METDELRLPLKNGWRRETTVREYSKSGVRGDVCYYGPCGKKFKQYPDIVRVSLSNVHLEMVNLKTFMFHQYLEKSGIKDLQREHFSFSTKIFIGEFLKPTGMSENGEEKYVTLNEQDMMEDVDKIRKENGWKPRVRAAARANSKKDVVTVTLNEVPKANNFLSENEKLLQRLSVENQREALRILKEAERMEKLEHARMEREQKQFQVMEAKRRKQEEHQRAKQEEALRRLQEKEAKKQQAAILREQVNHGSFLRKALFVHLFCCFFFVQGGRVFVSAHHGRFSVVFDTNSLTYS